MRRVTGVASPTASATASAEPDDGSKTGHKELKTLIMRRDNLGRWESNRVAVKIERQC